MNFVRRVFPYHLSENVPVDAEIEIFFFLDLNQGTVTPENVLLFNLTEERSEEVEFEYEARRLKIKPIEDLKPNMHYQVQLVGGKDGIKNIIGQEMAETYVSEFYTKKVKQIQPPRFITPTDMVEVTDDIRFEWRPVIDADYYELEVSRSNHFQHLVWPKKETPIYETSIIPHINYEPGTYYARIRSVSYDGTKSHYSKPIRYYYKGKKQTDNIHQPYREKGIILEPQGKIEKNMIQTLQQHFINEEDTQPSDSLKIVKSTPKHKTLNIKNTPISIVFNKNINPESVTSETIYLIEERN